MRTGVYSRGQTCFKCNVTGALGWPLGDLARSPCDPFSLGLCFLKGTVIALDNLPALTSCELLSKFRADLWEDQAFMGWPGMCEGLFQAVMPRRHWTWAYSSHGAPHPPKPTAFLACPKHSLNHEVLGPRKALQSVLVSYCCYHKLPQL